MEHYYKVLGLTSSASEEEVISQYQKLKKNYNPNNFPEGAQRKHAEKSLEEVTNAYKAIMSSLHPQYSTSGGSATATAQATQQATSGAYSYSSNTAKATSGEYIEHVDAEVVQDYQHNYAKTTREGREFYDYVRRMIQNGEYDTAIARLNSYANVNEAEWQFLMGSAMYYNGFVSDSYQHFKRAAEMAPNNREYTAMFSRMNNSRKGNVYSSPYKRKDLRDMDDMCDDVCSFIECMMCMRCLRGR